MASQKLQLHHENYNTQIPRYAILDTEFIREREENCMRAKLSNLQSIPQVVAEMTLEEKLDMVGCYRACHT